MAHLTDRTWFAVLPDCDDAAIAYERLTAPARVRRYASGRPCLVGPADPDGYHVAHADGTVLVRGPVSGVRRLFTARIGGVAVVTNRARVLAEARGAELDHAMIAASLVAPSPPPPLDPASLWRGVTAVPPDHEVRLDRSGTATTRRWWTPPEATRSVDDAADQLRAALESAVARLTGPLSADLSGGLDSTSLCFVAAQHHDRLRTVRFAPLDPASDDPHWAALAADRLQAEHVVLEPDFTVDELPDRAGDEPAGGVLTHAVVDHLARYARPTHLAGYGGDEVFGVSRAYLRGMAKRQPGKAIAHLRAHRALRSWSLADTLRALRDDRDYRQWIATTSAELRAAPVPDRTPQFSWGAAVRLPPWTTPAAADLVRGLLNDRAEPLAADVAQHRAIGAIRSSGQAARQIGELLAAKGVRLATPYLDDAVVNLGLSVGLSERGSPWSYKPLLTEAMRPIVPAVLLSRRTKGGFAADAMIGLTELRPLLAELCDDPVLARLGLVDADALRSACSTLDPTGRTLLGLEATLAMEIWLRALTNAVTS